MFRGDEETNESKMWGWGCLVLIFVLWFLLPTYLWKDVYLKSAWWVPPFNKDGRYTLEKTEKPSYLLAVESLTHCCSHTSFIIDLIETSYMGKRCSNLFIWYSCSVILPVIVALCVKIFTLH